jgi:integrase
MLAKLKLVKSAPTVEKQRVGGRKSDADYGRDGQKYLTPDQVAALIKTARQNTYGLRDALMISLTYHHALRVSELIGMRWNAIDWKRADIAVSVISHLVVTGFFVAIRSSLAHTSTDVIVIIRSSVFS